MSKARMFFKGRDVPALGVHLDAKRRMAEFDKLPRVVKAFIEEHGDRYAHALMLQGGRPILAVDARAVLHTIADRIATVGTAKDVAEEMGISPQYLHDVMHGRRAINDRIAELAGFERHVVYVRKES